MRVAITGAAGLFGYGLVQVFRARHEVFPLTRAEADLTDAAQVQAALRKAEPEVIIHPAGIPDLDVCEAEPEKAFAVNVEGTRHVVEVARALGAAVAYISTDAVFDGKKTTPYVETDAVNPRTVYGRTKLEAERVVAGLAAHWVFRMAVLFGPGKTNFVEKALRTIAAGEACVVAADQVGGAAYTLDAAAKMMEVVEARRPDGRGSPRYGLYHLANRGACTRLELAQRAAALAGLDAGKVMGKPRAEMGRRTVRLGYSVMEMGALRRAGFALPRPWDDALAEYVDSLPPF